MFLLTFHKEMKVLRPDDPEIVKLRILCQDRLRLCEEQFRKLSDRRFVNWLGRHHYTCRRRIEGMLEKLHAPAFEIAEHLQDSKKRLIVYLSRSLKMLNPNFSLLGLNRYSW